MGDTVFSMLQGGSLSIFCILYWVTSKLKGESALFKEELKIKYT